MLSSILLVVGATLKKMIIKSEKNLTLTFFFSMHKKQSIGSSDSHIQPITMASHNNGIWIRMLSMHSHNYGMQLVSKPELVQIQDSHDSGKVRWLIYSSFLTKLFFFSVE